MRLLLIIELILHALAAVAALLSCIGFGVATTKLVDSSSDSSLFGLAYGAASWIIIFALLDIGLKWRSRKEDRPSDSGLTGCLIFLHIITIAAAIGGFALSLFIGFRYESGTERDDGTIRTTDQFKTVWIFIGRYSILTAGIIHFWISVLLCIMCGSSRRQARRARIPSVALEERQVRKDPEAQPIAQDEGKQTQPTT